MHMKNSDPPLARCIDRERLNACIFLAKPFDNCYCMNISSSNIPKMLALCIGDYRSCAIYRRHQAETEAAGAANGMSHLKTAELKTSAKE